MAPAFPLLTECVHVCVITRAHPASCTPLTQFPPLPSHVGASAST